MDNPIFSLIVYRHDEERLEADDTSKDVGGGILTFTVELGVPEAKFRLIKNKLRARAFGADASDPSLDLDRDSRAVPGRIGICGCRG